MAELSSSKEYIRWFQLSPSGRHVAYQTTNHELYLRAVHDSASQPVRLASFPPLGQPFGFSPDGRYLALKEFASGRAALYVVDVEHPEPRQISSSEHDVRNAFWLDSPAPLAAGASTLPLRLHRHATPRVGHSTARATCGCHLASVSAQMYDELAGKMQLAEGAHWPHGSVSTKCTRRALRAMRP